MPATITDLADELGHKDGKRIRAYLRSQHTRATESKGSRWGDAKSGYALTDKIAAAVRVRFAPKADEEEATA